MLFEKKKYAGCFCFCCHVNNAWQIEELEEESNVLHILTRHPQDPYASALPSMTYSFVSLSVYPGTSPPFLSPLLLSPHPPHSMATNIDMRGRWDPAQAGVGFFSIKRKQGEAQGRAAWMSLSHCAASERRWYRTCYCVCLAGRVGGACTKKNLFLCCFFRGGHNACLCIYACADVPLCWSHGSPRLSTITNVCLSADLPPTSTRLHWNQVR